MLTVIDTVKLAKVPQLGAYKVFSGSMHEGEEFQIWSTKVKEGAGVLVSVELCATNQIGIIHFSTLHAEISLDLPWVCGHYSGQLRQPHRFREFKMEHNNYRRLHYLRHH